jgi:hypothetical protein
MVETSYNGRIPAISPDNSKYDSQFYLFFNSHVNVSFTSQVYYVNTNNVNSKQKNPREEIDHLIF